MNVIVIDSELWVQLNQKLDQLVNAKAEPAPTKKPSLNEALLAELKNYVHISEALPMLNISTQKWYRVYQYVLQYKEYGRDTWVYLPSMLEFMKSNNIIKKPKSIKKTKTIKKAA